MPQIDKAVSDSNFQIESCLSKLRLISDVMKEIGVIEDCSLVENSYYKAIALSKKSINSGNVLIITDGNILIVDSDNNKFGNLNLFHFDRGLYILSEDFNWDLFAEELLDSVHEVIYKGSKAREIKFSYIFEDPERELKGIKIRGHNV